MIILLCILLMFGLLQSLLELRKEGTIKSKWRIRQILSWLYIGGFVIGIIVAITQQEENNKVNQVIKGISSLVANIDSNSIKQLVSMSKTIEQTQSLIGKSDSINKSLIGVLEIKDSLLTQYKNVNAKLSKQLELETKRFKEQAPVITLIDNDISWEGTDSTSYSIKACIRNYGKRNALIMGGHGFILFFDKNKQPISNIDIPGNNNQYTLVSNNEVQEAGLCYFSHGIIDYKSIKSNTSFAVMLLIIHYKDVAMDNDRIEYFYRSWVPEMGFGGPKDWQINLAREWWIKNRKLGEIK